MTQNRLIYIDTDAGCDDALALFVLIKGQLDQKYTIAGISCSYGNVTRDLVINNVRRILRFIKHFRKDFEIPKIYLGAEGPSNIHNNLKVWGQAAEYHGHDGLGDVPEIDCQFGVCESLPDVEEETLTEALTNQASNFEFCCIGPATTLYNCLNENPEIKSKISKLWLMTGAFPLCFPAPSQSVELKRHGNMDWAHEKLHFAEHNAACDVPALKFLFDTQIETVIADWNLCIDYGLPWDYVENLSKISTKTLGSWYSKLIAVVVSNAAESNHFLIPDPLCTMLIGSPDLATSMVRGRVSVNDDVNSNKFGCTDLIECEGPHYVVSSLDFDQTFEILKSAIEME